jgi:hypothetical protein
MYITLCKKQKACVMHFNYSFHLYENYAAVHFSPSGSKDEKVAWISKDRKFIYLS